MCLVIPSSLALCVCVNVCADVSVYTCVDKNLCVDKSVYSAGRGSCSEISRPMPYRRPSQTTQNSGFSEQSVAILQKETPLRLHTRQGLQ